MTDHKSVLPQVDAADIQTDPKVYITHIDLENFPVKTLVTKIEVSYNYSLSKLLEARVYKINEPRVQGYIPSKVWFDARMLTCRLLYYTNSTMPSTARPFGDKPCYAFLKSVNDNETLSYDMNTRILIDQVMINEKMHYMFLFSEEQAKNVLTTDWDGNEWPKPEETALYEAGVQ